MKCITIKQPLKLDCGKEISNFPLAYETYGNLNEKKDNAILIFHALTGDQFASDINPVTNKEGWWNYAVGPGKAFDTKKFFVICANNKIFICINWLVLTNCKAPPTIFFCYRI